MPSSKEIIPVQNRILIEAEKVLGKKGISGLELKYIAKILKVAPSTINYHYSSSEELIFDTALFSYRKYVQTIFDESANISDPEKVLRIWIKNTFEWTKELPGIGVILEFPRQVIKYDKNSPAKAEELLKHFSRTSSETGIQNVAFLCSAIRSVQKKQSFRLYKPAQIAFFIANTIFKIPDYFCSIVICICTITCHLTINILSNILITKLKICNCFAMKISLSKLALKYPIHVL